MSACMLLLCLLLAACTNNDPVSREQAVRSVLERLDADARPADVTVQLESEIPHRFGDVEQMWVVKSEKGRWTGWVDVDTGELLDVIIELRSEGQL